MPSSAQPLRIALLQYGIAWCDPQANFALIRALLPQRGEVDVLLLPEAFATALKASSTCLRVTMPQNYGARAGRP